MARRAELEDRMADDAKLSDLAVYADLLIEEGDPRGELIACDLATGHGTPLRRRWDILEQLLGPVAFPWFRTTDFSYGFVQSISLGYGEEEAVAAEQALIDGPFGEYLCDITIHGSRQRIREVVKLLIRRTHRWLTQIQFQIHVPETGTTTIVDGETTSALIASTPALKKLIVTSDSPPAPVFSEFAHPNRPAIGDRMRPSGGIGWK